MRCQDYCGSEHNQWRCSTPGKRYMVKHKGCGPGEERVLCPFHKRRRRGQGQKVWLLSKIS